MTENRLQIEQIPPDTLTPYEGNPRIQEYGIVLPVLIDGSNVILAGYAVVQACRALEISEVPCVRASHLTEAQTGFEKREILRLRMDIADTPKDEDATPSESPSVVSREGDLWILGDHRLICGSSTDSETVSRLLAAAKPHLMVTDPPYGVNYDPAWALFPGDAAYIWHASLHGETVGKSLLVCGFGIRAQIIWAKPRFALSRGDYHWQHECCMYALRDTECPELAGMLYARAKRVIGREAHRPYVPANAEQFRAERDNLRAIFWERDNDNCS